MQLEELIYTICVNASEKILLQANSIKTILNQLVKCVEVLSFSSESLRSSQNQINYIRITKSRYKY